MVDYTVSSTVYDIPKSHWSCSLKNFEFPNAQAKEDVDRFLGQLDFRIEHLHDEGTLPNEDPPNVLMTGPPGVGKTHLSVAIYRWATMRAKIGDVRFIDVTDFCEEVKRGFDTGQDPFQKVEDVNVLLVLDDLFGRDLKQYAREHILPRLITEAYRNRASIVATTNYSKGELKNKIHPHQMSRLLQNGETWKFTGEDKRLKK